MPYLWIFIGCYSVVFCGTFLYMSRTVARTQAVMKANGISQQEINAFYRSMGAKTLLVLLWSTFFTGSLLGILGSFTYWLLR